MRVLNQEVGISLPDHSDGVIIEGLDFSHGKVSVMIFRDKELVGGFGGLKNTFKILDTLLLSRWDCGWKHQAERSL